MDMKTIFRAFGPNFKKDFLSEPFDSVHIYPLMCKLLEIQPAPHNGSLSVTEGFLLPSGEFLLSSSSIQLLKVGSVKHWYEIKSSERFEVTVNDRALRHKRFLPSVGNL